MAKVQTSEFKERPLIPAGKHILTLTSVEEKVVASQFGNMTRVNEKTGQEEKCAEKFLWVFTSETNTPEGEPYEHVEWTGKKYGNEKAALTILLDLLIPGIDTTTANGLDTDDLIGKRYEAKISHKTVDGKTFARAMYFEPLA